jgi:hypothetical protein
VSTTVVLWLMAAIYLAAHVPFLAKSPYDLDGVNFTLALHEYDLTKHQPHPPGAPLFVGLGRVARMALDWVTPGTPLPVDSRALDAAALGVWSAGFGALAVFGLFRLFAGLGLSRPHAAWATAATIASPLFWFSGARPMSDVPGLAVAALALGLLAPFLLPGSEPAAPRPRAHVAALLLGCFLAGVAPGIRVQMAWLAWPATLLVLGLAAYRRDRVAGYGLAALCAGVAAWFIPLTAIVGGPAEYARVLQLQATDDVVGGQMLALNFTPRAIVQALQDTFLAPWGAAWLAWIAVGAAAIGALRVLVRQPRLAGALAIVFGPYAALHLALHETTHIRYALPLVPPMALLATQGLTVLGRVGPAASVAIVTVSLAFASTAVVVHSETQAPAYQALDDVRSKLARRSDTRPVVAMHHAVGLALRGEAIGAQVLPSPLRYEWLEAAKYWRSGGTAPVWFLSSRRRTDLALIDPRSRHTIQSYRSPELSRPLIAGARPRSIDWIEIQPPGWVALEGWALTPEVRGVAVRDFQRNRRPRPSAIVRRRGEEVAMMLGGRNLGGPCSTAANVTVTIDGREVQRFSTRAGESFLHMWRLPAGSLRGPGQFAQLEIATEDRSGAGQQVDVAFEQFDVQDARHAIAGLGDGWFESEYEEREGLGFRWMSERAALRVDAFEHDVMVIVRGESPRRYFPQPSIVTVRAGDRVIAERELSADFEISARVPAVALRDAGGVIEISSSQAFVPDERSQNGDRRVLALRIFQADVRRVTASER